MIEHVMRSLTAWAIAEPEKRTAHPMPEAATSWTEELGTVYFRVSTAGVELVEPEDVTSFSVVRAPGTGDAALADLGEVLPGGEHVMVPVATVRRLAQGQVGEGWDADFAGMLAYATSKGWTTPDGTAVRAHVERT